MSNGVQDKLVSLLADICLDIDHKDSEALWEGTEFKLAYNEKVAEFGRADGPWENGTELIQKGVDHDV